MSGEAKFETEASVLPFSQSPPANDVTDKWPEKNYSESTTTGNKMSDGRRSPNTPVRSPSSYQQRATHSRSSSWSYTSGNGQVTLTHLNPIRSVIREFVPSFRSSRATGSQRSSSSSPLSPLSPSTYVDLSEAFRSDLESGMHRDTARLRNESSGFSNGNSNSAQSSETEEVNMNSGNIPGNTNPRTGGDRMEFQGTISWLEKSLPFVLLLLSRIMWDHRLGIIVFIGLCGTYLHANSTVKRQIALKDRRLNRVALWTFIFLSGNVFFIYYVFHNQQLQNCLIFMKPNFYQMDVWIVFWCVGITDFVIRMITMALKSFVVIQHRRIIPFRKRGKYYLLLEHLSQFYRKLVPIPLWVAYFTDYNYGGEYFAVVATTIYLLLKARMLFGKVKELYAAYQTFLHDVTYGSPPSKEQLLEAGTEACPICQEDLTDPIMLKTCKHIFCEDCISLWFDRERTCPMCRAKVAGDPMWRDGSTAAYVQLF